MISTTEIPNMKDLQWFMDRIGKTIYRHSTPHDFGHEDGDTIDIAIEDEAQAKKLFTIEQWGGKPLYRDKES